MFPTRALLVFFVYNKLSKHGQPTKNKALKKTIDFRKKKALQEAPADNTVPGDAEDVDASRASRDGASVRQGVPHVAVVAGGRASHHLLVSGSLQSRQAARDSFPVSCLRTPYRPTTRQILLCDVNSDVYCVKKYLVELNIFFYVSVAL